MSLADPVAMTYVICALIHQCMQPTIEQGISVVDQPTQPFSATCTKSTNGSAGQWVLSSQNIHFCKSQIPLCYPGCRPGHRPAAKPAATRFEHVEIARTWSQTGSNLA